MFNTTARHPSPSTRGVRSGAALLAVAVTLGACGSDAETTAPVTTTPTSAPPTTNATEAPGSTPADDLFAGIAERGFDGVVAVRRGEDVTARAFGIADRELGTATDTDTVFDIGSMTKQITAAAILRLEMDGALGTDDPLGDHIDGLPADIAAITLHQLLVHTSGMPVGFGPDDEPLDRDEFLSRVADTVLRSEPGARFEYSNVGYSLLALVVEAASGSSYETYLQEALFEPAGMFETGYVLRDWDDVTVAVGYDGVSGERFGRPNEQPWAADGPYWNLHGNGGLLSTAGDMLRWDAALIDGVVLDPAAHAKFIAPHLPDHPDEGVAYGYGWIVVPRATGGPIVTHGGSNGIFHGELLRIPDEDLAVFAITNSYAEAHGDVVTDVVDRLLGGLDATVDGTEPPDSPAAGAEHAGEVDADADPCGFASLTIASLPAHPEIAELPDSAAGQATELLVELLREGDARDRLDFATAHVADEFGGGDPAVVAAGLADLRELFGGNEVTQMFQEADDRFHLVTSGPAMDLMLSVGFDDAESARVMCLGITQ